MKKDGKWGIITDGGSGVVDFVLEDVAVNSLGAVYANDVAMVKKDGLWCILLHPQTSPERSHYEKVLLFL